MPAIPFPLHSSPGVRASESAGRVINAVVEKTDTGSPNQVIYRRAPGLLELVDVADHIGCRGAILVGSTLIAAFKDRVYAVTESAGQLGATDLGALSGSDPITTAKNSAATPNVVAVTAQGVFNLYTGAAPDAFADADLPQPNSVANHNNYLTFTTGDGTIWTTGINDVSVATNSFEKFQKPGGLLRGVSFADRFFAMGAHNIGVYRDIGASPFPFSLDTTIPRGIAGTFAVAGWEEGWANELLWVSDDSSVRQLNGNTGARVSTHAVERAIENCADRTALIASVAMAGGHPYWFLTSPNEWTWCLDLATMLWSERMSYHSNDWRGSQSVFAFDKWICGDRDTGKLLHFKAGHYREAGDPLIWELQSGVDATFPSRGRIPRADFDFTAGVGEAAGDDPIQTDPKVGISWSNDGGATWGNPLLRELGAQGRYQGKPFVLNTGMFKAQGRRWRLTVSDPVHVGFKGAVQAILADAE